MIVKKQWFKARLFFFFLEKLYFINDKKKSNGLIMQITQRKDIERDM